MKRIYTLIFMMALSGTAFSQNSETDELIQSKMKQLSFMTGDWKGSGWMLGKNGKSEFNQTEKIHYKLDSTAILIEGKGKSNGKVVHDALAILTYDKNKEQYSFRSYLPSGMNAEFKAEVIDNKLYWYPNDNVRYVIWLNENGQWYETGEYKKGETWNQFFDMTLDRDE